VWVLLDDYRWGAQLATDLVNTAPEVMVSTGEGLPDPDALARFLNAHRLHHNALADGQKPDTADLTAIHRLRAAIRAVIDEPDPAARLTEVEALTQGAGAGPGLHHDDTGPWRWRIRTRPGAALADELALVVGTGLLGVIHTLGPDRFRQCEAPTCTGAFVDSSRAGRRRYCEPKVCGNRVNIARYRARNREGTPPGE
jgi:predicted RNA-binding Zn ribbon-like protein